MFQFPKRLAFVLVTLSLVLLATGAFALRPTQAAAPVRPTSPNTAITTASAGQPEIIRVT